MKKNIILISLLIISVLLIGCNEESIENKMSTKEYSDMALELNDFPEGWSLFSRAERAKSDVSDNGLGLGWKGGYTVVMQKRDPNNVFLFEEVVQYISKYPLENMDKAFASDDENEEELSDPGIGEKSAAYKITYEDEFGDKGSYYQIVFYKKDILVTIMSDGTTQDYELLKEITKKAENKIK